MTDVINLALTYGGFTRLDMVYLKNVLAQLSDHDKLTFITPPPSVINAYFAELYQKESPEAATDYFYHMCLALKLHTKSPSFDESKPFVRLNLSDKSYGFTYESEQEVALVFAEVKEEIAADLLFELAQIFPHYTIYEEENQIKMAKMAWDETEHEELETGNYLLSHASKLKDGTIKISSFNQEECLELATEYQGKKYYQYHQREFVVYVVQAM